MEKRTIVSWASLASLLGTYAASVTANKMIRSEHPGMGKYEAFQYAFDNAHYSWNIFSWGAEEWQNVVAPLPFFSWLVLIGSLGRVRKNPR